MSKSSSVRAAEPVGGSPASGGGSPPRITLFATLTFVLLGVSAFSTAVALVVQDGGLARDLDRAAQDRLARAVRVTRRLIDIHLNAALERYLAISRTPQFRANLEVDHAPTLAHYAEELVSKQESSSVFFLNAAGSIVAAAGDAEVAPEAMPLNGASLVLVDGQPRLAVGVPLSTESRLVGRLLAIERLDSAVVRQWSDLAGADIVFGSAKSSMGELVAELPMFANLDIAVRISLAAEREALMNSRKHLLFAGVGALLVALFTSLMYSRRLVSSIRRIKEAAMRIGEGNFSIRIGSPRSDELGDVARSVDDMAARLEQLDFVQAILDGLPDAVLLMDEAGKIVRCNRAVGSLGGNGVESWWTLLDPASHERAREVLSEVSAGEVEHAWVETTLASSERHYFWAIVPLGHAILVSGRDITERIRSEEMRIARDEALEALRLKGEFLANVSHELRTPMNGVVGGIGLLLDTSLTSEQRTFAEMVQASAQAQLSVINDVLDFSKMEAGRLGIERHPFNLRSVVEEAAALMSVQAVDKGIDLRIHYAVDAPRHLIGDAGRIRQILVNLIGNAVKFTKAGYVQLTISSDGETEGSATMRLAVEDSGIGIPEHKLGQIFNKFTQVDGSITRKYGGTGLGLAICKELVELMGGRIGVSSRLGEGSTFWITLELPVVASPVEPLGGERPNALCRVTEEEQRPLRARILIAEDNPINQRIAAVMLEKLGCRVDVVASGKDAVEMVQRFPYNLVLMDCWMPEMDGWTATELVRKHDGPMRNVPIIAMTALADAEDLDRCTAAGMDDLLRKPLDLASLRRTLERWIDRRAKSRTHDDSDGSESSKPGAVGRPV